MPDFAKKCTKMGSGLRFGHNLRTLNWAKVTLGEASSKWRSGILKGVEGSDADTTEALQYSRGSEFAGS